ncbi:hypothetical protein [Streptomyces sp. NRRL S-1448]|uniref:hypothetical protein n=1 Tax=Streptomyces sp. NRRL S-1448 TaxID=1463883 RepID=UPI000A5987B8|nr:hypothetical protein [Streptomyces sp. NRRL S-1448]
MFGRKSSSTDAVTAHKAALKALHDNQRAEQAAGIREETDTYRELNAAVHEAEKHVPWYRR